MRPKGVAGFRVNWAPLGNELCCLPVDPQRHPVGHEAISAAMQAGNITQTSHHFIIPGPDRDRSVATTINLSGGDARPTSSTTFDCCFLVAHATRVSAGEPC